jgi:aryl-alcohol dehydrogenase-like predicted oxidoreductase
MSRADVDDIPGIGAFYGKTDESAAMKALTYAADRGMTFWDCADIYGTCEFHTL